MIRVLNDSEAPPGGWKLTVPQTGTTLQSPFIRTLRSQTLKHLAANGHEPRPDFDDWFEDAACRESGHREPFCGPNLPPLMDAQKQKLVTPGKAKRFLKAMLEVLRNRKLVSKEEVQRRRAICLACPMAGEIGACWGCFAVFRRASRLLGKKHMESMPKEKRWCLCCGCHIPTKSMIPNDVLDHAEEGEVEYPTNCWRLQSSEEE